MKKNLVNIESIGKGLHLWYINEDKTVSYNVDYNFKPYFYTESPNGKYQTIDKKNVSKIFFDDPYSLKEAKSNYNKTWESDIDYKTRYLIDRNIYRCNIDSGLLPVKTWFIDMECITGDKFPNPKNAANSINAISFYDNFLDDIITLAYHPEEYKKNYEDYKKRNIIIYENEEEMLLGFVKYVENLRPFILSGWNSEIFDYPYILNRIVNKLGWDEARKLSPINKVDINNQTEHYKVYGITELDYLKLYKQKFAINSRESYSLAYIAQCELGETKLEYEGNLDNLWKNNFEKFIEYNRNDVLLVKKLDDKLKYIDLSRELTSTCNTELRNVFFNSALNEALILTKTKEKNIVCPDKKTNIEKEDPYAGAYVMDPIVGVHSNIFTLDLTSLYPSIIRSCNMCPTTIVKDNTFDNEDYFKTSNGALFRKDKKGIIPEILDELFETRVFYRKKLSEAKKENNENEIYQYDLKQYTMKILLNSMYGYLGMPGGRFYDRDIAEGVTLTGQMIIKSTKKYIEDRYDGFLEMIYSDTDSVFVKVKNDNIEKEDIIKVADKLKDKLNNIHLNNIAKEECNITDKEPHYFSFKFEKVVKSGLFLAKKRYALNIIWEEGMNKDTELKITGMETVRSDTPRIGREFLTTLIKMILDYKSEEELNKYIVEFKDHLQKEKNLVNLGLPTGVKGIYKYVNTNPNSLEESSLCKLKTPIHVRAAINYNAYFSRWGKDERFPIINDNSKIKWLYVKYTPTLPFSVMAFTDDNLEHMKVFEIDIDTISKRIIDKKIENIYIPLGWSLPKNGNYHQLEQDLFL